MKADGNIPIFAQDIRVRGLASKDGSVNKISMTFSENNIRNNGTKEAGFLSNSPLPQIPSNFAVLMSSQLLDMNEYINAGCTNRRVQARLLY